MSTVDQLGASGPSQQRLDPLIQQAFKSVRGMRNAIRRYHRAGEVGRARDQQRRLLKSYHGRLAALAIANRSLHADDRHPPEALLRLAGGLDLFAPCDEPVVGAYQEKPRGRVRERHGFGLRQRARQILAYRGLAELFQPPPWQFGVKGKGRDDAAVEVRRQLGEGCGWFVRANIKDPWDCFVSSKVMAHVPLPRAVIENVILYNALNIVPDETAACIRVGGRSFHPGYEYYSYHDLIGPSRLIGIPRGSFASPLVSSFLLSNILSDLPVCSRFLCGHSILLLVPTEIEALQAKQTLTTRAECHRAGPLCLQDVVVGQTSDGFDYLGYSFKLECDNVIVEPPQSKFDLVQAVITAQLIALRELDTLPDYIAKWKEQYPLWLEGNLWAAHSLNSVDLARTGRPIPFQNEAGELIWVVPGRRELTFAPAP